MSPSTLDSMLALSLLQLGGGTEAEASSDIYAQIAATAASIAHAARSAGITLEIDGAALTGYLEAKKPDLVHAANEVYAVASKDGEQIFAVFAGGSVVMRNEYAWLGFAAGLAEDADVGGYPPLAQRRLEKLVTTFAAALRQSSDGLRGLATYNVHPITLERFEYRPQS
ncbi:MAG: hypothetical protein J0H65_00325 [Rhizobiales bacterium]|nr:hypothetical protein [Hyphomicrobiales bacterium]